MGARQQAYTLYWRPEKGGWYIRGTHDGQRFHVAVGFRLERKAREAGRLAKEAFAQIVNGERRQRRPAPRAVSLETWKAAELWLESLSLRPDTVRVYRGTYSVRWIAHWDTLRDITGHSLALYVRRRLRSVQGKNVRDELSALRGCLNFAALNGWLAELPEFPAVKRSEGTVSEHRHRWPACALEPEQVAAIIAALPEWSPRGDVALRGRAIVSYLLCMRPETVSRLSKPRHWSDGQETIWISGDIDKEKNERELWLPMPARAALESCAPEVGLIFGEHKSTLSREIKKVAQELSSSLPSYATEHICFQWFRSFGLSHGLANHADVAAWQRIAGHLDPKTTFGYVKATAAASQRASAGWQPKLAPVSGPRQEGPAAAAKKKAKGRS